MKIHQICKHNLSIQSVQSCPCATYPPTISPSSFQHPRQCRRAVLGLRAEVWTSRLLPRAFGEKERWGKRSKGEEMMEGRPTIRVCFLACWGLQPNLLHLLTNSSWRVIRRVKRGWKDLGVGGDLVRHLYRARWVLCTLSTSAHVFFSHSMTLYPPADPVPQHEYTVYVECCPPSPLTR